MNNQVDERFISNHKEMRYRKMEALRKRAWIGILFEMDIPEKIKFIGLIADYEEEEKPEENIFIVGIYDEREKPVSIYTCAEDIIVYIDERIYKCVILSQDQLEIYNVSSRGDCIRIHGCEIRERTKLKYR